MYLGNKHNFMMICLFVYAYHVCVNDANNFDINMKS